MKFLQRKRVHNAGNPKGFWGVVTLRNMNRDHAILTEYGLSLIDISKHAVCLDIGCGGGKTLSRLSKIALNGKLYGVDISKTAVKLSNRLNHRDIKSGKMEIRVSAVNELPFREGTFDVVTAVETFYFWDNKNQALETVCGVLKRGGVFLIMLDAYEGSTADISEIQQEIELELNSAEEIKKMLISAGFSVATSIINGNRLYVKGIK